MSMAATKISRFFIIFTALLLDKIAGYKAKETRTTTGRLTRPELTSDLNNFLSKGPMKSGDPPTETDQANWKKRTSKETATAQQPRDQDLHHSRHFFDHDYTGFDGAFAHTLKETTKASRWIAYTTIHPDQTPQNIPIPAQERKQEMKFYLHNDLVWKITRFFRAFQTPEILYPWEILYTPSLGPGLPRPSNLGH
jgi:hypothetical protein